ELNGWTISNGSILNPIDPYTMVDQGGGHYTATIGEPGELFSDDPYNWKIAGGGDNNWATSMPASDARVYTYANGQINSHLYAQTTWDDGWSRSNSRRVGYDDSQQFGWEIVGDFNNWSGTHD